jgi:hypothetical protein
LAQGVFLALPNTVNREFPTSSVRTSIVATQAKTQGFKHHAWHRVKELENDIYGYYNGIEAEFLQKVKENQ